MHVILDELIGLLESQIQKGGLQEKIRQRTLTLIADDRFHDLPEKVQDAIYQLDMSDLNQFDSDDYTDVLQIIKGVKKP